MHRIVVVIVAALLALGALAPVGAGVAAQEPPDDAVRAADAADFARLLSRLEAGRDWPTLAALMHPDSQDAVPAAAVVGWYEAEFRGKTTAELTVTGVRFEAWTWGVSGRRYDDAASIAFVQPYWTDGVRSDVSGTLHLVRHDGGWGWFFGASPSFVAGEIARYAPDAVRAPRAGLSAAEERAARFPDPLHAHVDAYWADRFAEAGRPYTPPRGVIGFSEPMPTGCGMADPDSETAFYCVLDRTIYYSTAFRDAVERNIGDFGWVVVVAHEWGHHVQVQLGYDLGVVSYRAGSAPPVAVEQQADCLAGAYTESAELDGWLDPGDVDEALLMTELSGDPGGARLDDPLAHGSGPERVTAFTDGYQSGLTGCHLDLAGG